MQQRRVSAIAFAKQVIWRNGRRNRRIEDTLENVTSYIYGVSRYQTAKLYE